MATSTPQAAIALSLTLTLNESEVRALDALMGYGIDPFLEVFYKHLGTHYMKPNEPGLRALFETMRPQCLRSIRRVDAARKAFQEGA
jgi:hypothetical protein